MSAYTQKSKINRIIDANINRAKEGLRVCEEIARFALNNHGLTAELKKIRHEVGQLTKRLPGKFEDLLRARKSLRDTGKNIYINELKRSNTADIFFANMQRVKESIRVLEEFNKLIKISLAVEFKKLRYEVYEIEKKAARKISALLYPR